MRLRRLIVALVVALLALAVPATGASAFKVSGQIAQAAPNGGPAVYMFKLRCFVWVFVDTNPSRQPWPTLFALSSDYIDECDGSPGGAEPGERVTMIGQVVAPNRYDGVPLFVEIFAAKKK